MRHASKRAIRVSIHASAREATFGLGDHRIRQTQVSIHASAREATKRPECPSNQAPCFNPRLRTGGDIVGGCGLIGFCSFQSTPPHGRRRAPVTVTLPEEEVSIHASAREATCRRAGCHNLQLCFNPRLRTGGDITIGPMSSHTLPFQSTPPHGRRPWLRRVKEDFWQFQSTPPHGRRQWRHLCGGNGILVSIHASAREATTNFKQVLTNLEGFNPRLRTGGDLGEVLPDNVLFVSIHASAREATPQLLASCLAVRCFNPRLRTGGDSIDATPAPHWFPVSIHASAREATRPGTYRRYSFLGFNPRLRTGGDG